MSPWTHGAVQHCKWTPAVIAALNRGDSPAFRPLPRSGYASRWFAISSAGTPARSAMHGRGSTRRCQCESWQQFAQQAAQSAAAETSQVRLIPGAPRLRSRLICSVGAAATADGAVGGAGNDSATNSGIGSATFVDAADRTGPAPRARRHWCTRLSFSPNHSAAAATEARRRFGACAQNLRLEPRAGPATRLRVDAHGCLSESRLDSVVCVPPNAPQGGPTGVPTTPSNAGSSPGRWAARRGSSAAASWPASGRAMVMRLVRSAKLNGPDPWDDLRDVHARLRNCGTPRCANGLRCGASGSGLRELMPSEFMKPALTNSPVATESSRRRPEAFVRAAREVEAGLLAQDHRLKLLQHFVTRV
jgi:hypothetical protein